MDSAEALCLSGFCEAFLATHRWLMFFCVCCGTACAIMSLRLLVSMGSGPTAQRLSRPFQKAEHTLGSGIA